MIREQDFYHVDKTPTVRRLVDEGRFYFLSRPRRIGDEPLPMLTEKFRRGSAGIDN